MHRDDRLEIVQNTPDHQPSTTRSSRSISFELAWSYTRRLLPNEQSVGPAANVNQNFPEPICPLLYSIAADGYYHYFRNLGVAFGIERHRLHAMEYPLRHLIGVHCGRMYYNLTNIHSVTRQAPLGDILTRYFNLFVGVASSAPPAIIERKNRLFEILELGRTLCFAAGSSCSLRDV